MADLEKQKIQQDLEQIRDERRKAANTAERIGQALLELLHFIEESGKRYLSREHDDTADGLITFNKGLNCLGDILATGKVTVQDLEVLGKALFHELEIRKLSYAGGNIYLSGAGSKIVHVEEQRSASGAVTGWKCYLLADDGSTATQNLWRVKDQARCQSFNILEGKHEGVSNKSYWRLVTDVSTQPVTITAADGTVLYGGRLFDWVILSATDCMAGSDTPTAGDTIVLDGAREDATRQGVQMLESTGNGTPRIVGLRGVNSYTHEGKEVFVLSPNGSKIVSSYIEWVSSTGEAMHMVNYRGEWQKGVSYAYYDQVSHGNGVWLCTNAEGSTSEPMAGSADWQLVMSAQKGEKGEDGAQGKPGKDGITWTLTPDILTYDTDDSGKAINVGTGKATTLRVLRGNEELTNFTIKGVKNMVNCVASRLNNTSSFYISAITVQKVTLGTDTMDVSCTNGSFDVEFAVDGVTYTATAKFAVNVSAFTGRMTLNNKQYESKFTEISNKFNKDLANAESRITQAAREISISVSEKSIGRRNLLVGSAFNRQEGFGLNRDSNIRGYGILMNDGVDGMNCIKVASYYDTNRYQYCGAFWGGSYTKNIRIKHGTQYTFSCWVKVDEADTIVYLEVIYNRAEIGQDRDGRPTGAYAFAIKEPNKWQLVKWSFTTDDTHNWIEANVFTCSEVAYKTFVARFCKPMLEEGDYNGWTLSQEDYDYVGGNLLEDTMALTRSSDNSNLQFASGLIMFSKYEGCYGILYNKNNSAESQLTEALQYKFPTTATLSGQARIVKNQDYVFSFVAKGSGNINVFLYGDSVHANVFTETCEGNVYPVGWADGYAQLALTSTYKRYWVHWRINDYTGDGAEVIPDKVLIRVPGDTEAWVTKPKLEEGAQLTDYTERKTDLIDRATAKAAGLEITSRGVTLYGEKIKVENTLSTGQTTTAALFKDGAINAALILAQMLTSQGHNGQMVRIANGLINIYGKAGTANIRFGLNSSGQAVLSYYDDNGNFLYDLGPAGIASLSKTDAKITSAQYIKAEDAGLTTPLGENVDLPWVDTTKSWYTATKDNNYILFVKGATGKKTTLYRYSAPRVNGKIVADSANGLSTYDLASAADGRTFTSRTMVKNGALTNLADGVFLTGDVTVYDNTKLVPSIKKGQSVTRPSFYVQTASFNAKFTTLGWFGRIYSIQTEITFGNLDVGIMSNNY